MVGACFLPIFSRLNFLGSFSAFTRLLLLHSHGLPTSIKWDLS
jgi:hypothetical protein